MEEHTVTSEIAQAQDDDTQASPAVAVAAAAVADPASTETPASPGRGAGEGLKTRLESMFNRVRTASKTGAAPATKATSPRGDMVLPSSNSYAGTPYRELLKDVSFDVFVRHVDQGFENTRTVIDFLRKVALSEETYGKSLLGLSNKEAGLVAKMFRKKPEVTEPASGTVRNMLHDLAEHQREEGQQRINYATEIGSQCIGPLKTFLKTCAIREVLDNAGREHKAMGEKRAAAPRARNLHAKACSELEKTKQTQDTLKISKAQQKVDSSREELARLIEAANTAHSDFYTQHMAVVYEAVQGFDEARVEQVRRAMHLLVTLRAAIVDKFGPSTPLEEAVTAVTQEAEILSFLGQPDVPGSIETPIEFQGLDEDKVKEIDDSTNDDSNNNNNQAGDDGNGNDAERAANDHTNDSTVANANDNDSDRQDDVDGASDQQVVAGGEDSAAKEDNKDNSQE